MTCVSGQLSTYDGNADAFGSCAWEAENPRALVAATEASALLGLIRPPPLRTASAALFPENMLLLGEYPLQQVSRCLEG